MQLPRILFTAPSSASGKTTVTCGILQALINRGQSISSFKCGPDYVDPMFHSKIIGTKSRNLDPFMMAEPVMKHLLCKNSRHADISVIEGVMGYYDGLGGNTTDASTYSVAKATQTPVVLIVNGKGMSTSIVPLIQGFLHYKKDSAIKGVILNQISPMMYPRLKALIEEQLPVTVYGYLPFMEDCVLENRPLGLIPAGELPQIQAQLQRLAKQAEETIDIDGLLALANTANKITDSPFHSASVITSKAPVNIGIAKDIAFCFYYEDNLELLTELGANLIPFSPIHDTSLPNNLDGLLLGGGYADLYANELSQNQTMRQSIYDAVKHGMPCIAEGSGFSYLHQTMSDDQGNPKTMVGIFSEHIQTAKRLQNFGYFMLTANENTLLLNQGEQLPIHEFHYQYSSNDGNACLAVKPNSKKAHSCIHASNTLWAGFPHLHFYANPMVAERFIQACRNHSTKLK